MRSPWLTAPRADAQSSDQAGSDLAHAGPIQARIAVASAESLSTRQPSAAAKIVNLQDARRWRRASDARRRSLCGGRLHTPNP